MPMPKEFKRAFVASFERAARYRDQPPAPKPRASLTQLRQAFDIGLPQRGRDAEVVIEALAQAAEPGLIGISSPDFYGWVMGSSHPVGIAADWLVSSWGQNAGIFHTSPAAAVAEEVAGSWLLDLLQLPGESAVGFVTGATMAGFTALSSARTRAYKNLGYDLKKGGLRNAPKIRFIISEDIHATNVRSLNYMGHGTDEFEFVPVDDEGRVIVDQMPQLDESCIVVIQAGNINSGAFDDFKTICARAKTAGAWVHVDAAFGGWIKVSKSRRHLTDGMELADSWSIDCHKWLNVPYDSAIAICRDREVMLETFTISASYLTTDGERIPNNFTPELSRRARGIDVWAALKHLGREGFGDLIDQCCDHAKWFAAELEKNGFTIMNDVVINQVVFCLADNDDQRLKEIMDKVAASGKTWFGPTNWHGRTVYRMSISSHETNQADLDVALNSIKIAMN